MGLGFVRSAALCVALLSLSACGGGGGSSAPPASSAPTPAPTSPLPMPTATSSPTPIYALATDFSADRQYTGWGVEAVRDYRAPPPGSPGGTQGTVTYTVTLKPETLGAGFSYDAASKTYVVRWVDFTKTYGPTADGLNLGRSPFSTLDDFLRYHPWTDNASGDYARYFGAIRWNRNEGTGNGATDSLSRSYSAIFGTKTVPGDLPSSGTVAFTFFPEISAVNPPRTSSGSDIYRIVQNSWFARIDFATRTLTGTLRLDPSSAAPPGTAPLTITMSGSIETDRTSVSGQFSGTGIGGEFTGNLFGPQGRELGFAYRITINGAEAYAGATGSKGY